MNSFKQLRVDEEPDGPRWKLIPLYKYSVNGSYIMWEIGCDEDKKLLYMTHGTVGGIIRTDETEIELNSSGREIREQAKIQARRRYTNKWKEGYSPLKSNTAPMKKAMKGYEYKEGMIERWPVVVEVKLNGIRLLIEAVSSTRLVCRTNLNSEYTHLGHITETLLPLFQYLPAGSTLDGELYCHEMKFTDLTSAVKTMKTIHPDLHRVRYHIFDIYYEENESFECRYNLLLSAYNKYIEDLSGDSLDSFDKKPSSIDLNKLPFCLISATLAYNHEELTYHRDEFIRQGYEGIMIKKIAGDEPTKLSIQESRYVLGRTHNILKYKDFIDEEVIVLGLEEAKGTEKGTALLVVKDPRGNVFNIRMKGSFDRRKYWLEHPKEIIGKEVTIRYQELSPYGVPIFPRGIAVRDYE